MKFKNTSVYFIPVSFDNYSEITSFYRNSSLWSQMSVEETQTQYLLDYAFKLSTDLQRYCCFRYKAPQSAPVFMHDDEFTGPRIEEIRLSCFSTGIDFLEFWVGYHNLSLDKIIDFSYRFKKAKVSGRKQIPNGKLSLYDFATSLLLSDKSSLFFPYSAPFKYE